MDTQIRRRQAGFTLIELIITVTIIAILARLAMMSYLGSEMKAHRTDATTTLSSASQTLERCYSQYYYYSGSPDCTAPAVNSRTPSGYYYFSTVTRTATTYTLTLTPVSGGIQSKDTTCTSFTINYQGLRTATPSANSGTCWGTG